MEIEKVGYPVASGNPGRLEDGRGIASGKGGINVREMIQGQLGKVVPYLNVINGRMEYDVHEVCRLLEGKARMFLRVRGLVLGVQVMQPDELGQADIAALATVFHEMLEKVTHLDQFSG